MTKTSENSTDAAGEEPPIRAAGVIRAAMEQLAELLAQPAEAVTACERDAEGAWRVTVEVLELPRIPDTMSLLSSYEVELDGRGDLIAYRRTRRYERGRADRR